VISWGDTTVKLCAARAPKFTEVAPARLAPVIVTTVPALPLEGVRLVIPGTIRIVNEREPVAVPPAVVTDIGPVVAPAGTMAVMRVDEFTAKAESRPLNLTD
jgi:hypothetical protein